METQGIQSSQNNFEKEQRFTFSNFKSHCKAIVNKSVVL